MQASIIFVDSRGRAVVYDSAKENLSRFERRNVKDMSEDEFIKHFTGKEMREHFRQQAAGI